MNVFILVRSHNYMFTATLFQYVLVPSWQLIIQVVFVMFSI
jgi:hypothetical protein